jgi:pre-mRNA-splicing factor ATP-dependent RNA helicase DHX16
LEEAQSDGEKETDGFVVKKKEKKQKKMRSKAREEEDEEPDQTAELIDEFKAKRRAMYEQDEDMPVEEEEIDQLERDIRERDEFAERLREKDAEKTSGPKKSKRERDEEERAESRKRLAEDGDARKKALPDMRDKSRQEYLIKRGAQQVELLRREVEDERLMFNREELSARERRELEYKEQILRITDERSQIRDKVEGYQVFF